ncbi:MAG: DUF6879 family protein [Candidatus Dormibacteraceae bacterium]
MNEINPPENESAVRIPVEILTKAAEALSQTPLSEEEFDQAFASCQLSAFRLETFPEYKLANEEATFREFRKTGLLPESIKNGDWLEEIRETTRKGIRNCRIHVVEHPLSKYLEFEMASYHESVKAGEEVRIADANLHPELKSLNEDFWLFDGEGPGNDGDLLMMKYAEDGQYLGVTRSSSCETIQRCKAQRDLALALSVPFNEYIQAHSLPLAAVV